MLQAQIKSLENGIPNRRTRHPVNSLSDPIPSDRQSSSMGGSGQPGPSRGPYPRWPSQGHQGSHAVDRRSHPDTTHYGSAVPGVQDHRGEIHRRGSVRCSSTPFVEEPEFDQEHCRGTRDSAARRSVSRASAASSQHPRSGRTHFSEVVRAYTPSYDSDSSREFQRFPVQESPETTVGSLGLIGVRPRAPSVTVTVPDEPVNGAAQSHPRRFERRSEDLRNGTLPTRRQQRGGVEGRDGIGRENRGIYEASGIAGTLRLRLVG